MPTTTAAASTKLRIYTLWHEGKSAPEIAKRLGIKPGSVNSIMSVMRSTGWDLPYRSPTSVENARRLHEGRR